MNKRQYDILKELYQKPDFTTFGELAARMNVSVKTVRNDISYIKEILSSRQCGMIETKPHIGIRLVITDKEWKILNGESSDGEEKEIIFFIIRHLFKNGNLTMQKLSEQYYIGRTQLDKILDKAAAWLSENRILLERRRGKGISIQYSEFNYRLALLNFYTESVQRYSELINERESLYVFMPPTDYTALCAALDGFDADIAARAIMETEQEFGLKFNYSSGVNLLFLTSASILRSRRGHEVEMPKTIKCPTDGKFDVLFAKSLCENIEKQQGKSLSKSEREFIAFAVSISEIHEFESEQSRRNLEMLNIELCRMTVKAVNLISDIVDINLSEDRFFVKDMFMQLKVSIARIKYGVIFKNQLLGQIKTKYPNMMAVAWLLGNIFEKELRLEINEHEVGYLALHIGGAIERQLACLSACIVCDYGIGISQILREKITRSIPDLKITSVFSGRDIRSIKNEPCDFIISTTPLTDYRISRDIVKIEHLLGENDIKLLEAEMKKIRLSRRGGIKNIKVNTSLFKRELIFPQCSVSSKKELLHMLCSRLEALGYVTSAFEKTVFDREESTATDIGNGFAIPHGLSKYVNHSVAVFASLKQPIEWNLSGELADIVFLLAFDLDEDEDVKNEIIRFYKSIVSFMEDKNECERLKSLTDDEKIIKILELW